MKIFAALDRKRWATVITSVGLAFFSGYIMQNELSIAQSRKDAAAIITPSDPSPAEAALQAPPVLKSRVSETRVARRTGCEPDANMSESATGMVHLSLVTQCHIGRPVKLWINDLRVDVETDASGKWEGEVPALSSHLVARFEFGELTLERTLDVKSAAAFQHVLLAWRGSQTFMIHVEPLGAGAEDLRRKLVRVGSADGHSIEVFSFPASSNSGASVLRLAVDAAVTEENCGKQASVTAFQTGFSGALRPSEISYTMPTCDRVGDTVRLQNLFRDMRLAAR